MTPEAVAPHSKVSAALIRALPLLAATASGAAAVLAARRDTAADAAWYVAAAVALALVTLLSTPAALGARLTKRRAEAEAARLRADGVTTRGRIIAVQVADPGIRAGHRTLRLTVAYRRADGERATVPHTGRFPVDALPQAGLPATVRYLPADPTVVAVTLPSTTILDLDGYVPRAPTGET